jgi:hypothetical protein
MILPGFIISPSYTRRDAINGQSPVGRILKVIFGFFPSPLEVDALITSGEGVLQGIVVWKKAHLRIPVKDSKHTHPLCQRKIFLFSFFLRENRIKI